MTHLHFIIRKPIWYDESRELALAFQSLLDVIRQFQSVNIILLESSTPPDKTNHFELDEAISQALDEIKIQSDNDFIFFIKDPALLVSPLVIERMTNILKQQNIQCVLPSSYPEEFPATDKNQHYFTLQSYQHYVSEVLAPEAKAIKAFDQRSSHFFAVRYQFLINQQIHSGYFQIPEQFPEQTAIAMGAYIHPFVDYFHGANLDMLEYIPAAAGNLLDIGCSSGEFGAAVIHQLNLQVEGIEINHSAAEIARDKLHKVYQGDALTLQTDQQFDCVTCLDVLEHFPNPDALLKQISDNYLHDKGTLLLNLPNIGHWSIVEDLLSGHWDYVPGGTLCHTHLQFFTRHTILTMLERNHYQLIEIIPTQVDLPDRIHKRLALLETDGQIIDRENLKTISFKVIAQKETNS